MFPKCCGEYVSIRCLTINFSSLTSLTFSGFALSYLFGVLKIRENLSHLPAVLKLLSCFAETKTSGSIRNATNPSFSGTGGRLKKFGFVDIVDTAGPISVHLAHEAHGSLQSTRELA